MNWKIGDRALCVCPGPYYLEECTILSGLFPKTYKSLDPAGIQQDELVYEVDLDPIQGGFRAGVMMVERPEMLRPINDGNEKTTWEAMKDIWQPNRIEA